MVDVVVVGGGAAGAAVFGELIGRADAGCVHWVTGQGRPGRGVAYSTGEDHHLLNVRAAGMGLFDGPGSVFARHPAAGDAEPHQFVPRSRYGDYVQARLAERSRAARQAGRCFELHAATAVDAWRDGGRWRVRLEGGATLEADEVVLATGALEPRPLRNASSEALASGAYVVDPWQTREPPAPPGRVLVVGTGLTAVDVLLSAARRWPGARLQAVSRHGRLPFIHREHPAAPWPGQAALNEALLGTTRVRERLRALRWAMDGAPDWQAIVDGMRPVMVPLWQGLPVAERRRFLRHLRWLWEAARHRMPPASANVLQRLQAEGRLRIAAARVLGVDGKGPLQVRIRARGAEGESSIEADLVVQATGLEMSPATATGLLRQLLDRGLAAPDPLRLGLAGTEDGRLTGPGGGIQPGLSAIGPLLRGTLWECTAMPEIRVAARALAERLLPAD